MATKQTFYTKQGFEFPGVSLSDTLQIRSALTQDYGLSYTHIAEAASYSMSMVVRVALGLSANESKITVLANNSLSGKVALAALRHLTNGGSSAQLFLLQSSSNNHDFISDELKILKAMGIEATAADKDESLLKDINTAIANSHNVVCGLFEINSPSSAPHPSIIEALNESKTPVHCIDVPTGIDADTGLASAAPLFASSTLSLGSAFQGLFSGESYVGRHYLCDISLPTKLYQTCGYDLSPLFSEQPVLQIFPKQLEEL